MVTFIRFLSLHLNIYFDTRVPKNSEAVLHRPLMKVGGCLCITNHWGSAPCLPLPHKPFHPLSSPPSPVSDHLWPKPSNLSSQPPSSSVIPGNPARVGKDTGWSAMHACSSQPFQSPLPLPSLGTAAASRDTWMNYCCFVSCPWNQPESHPKIHDRTVLYTPCIKLITFFSFLADLTPLITSEVPVHPWSALSLFTTSLNSHPWQIKYITSLKKLYSVVSVF